VTMDIDANDIPPQAARLAPKLRALADRGVYFGTSSWKYDGSLGSIYSQDRYLTRGKFSNTKFEEHCLTEYAETFPAVCGDLTVYQFPSEQYWAKLFDATPQHFTFGFKVPEDITVSTWPKHARYGRRAGLANEHFLDPETFERFFTARLEPYGKPVGPLIFEFGTFNKSTFPTRADFIARLDPFSQRTTLQSTDHGLFAFGAIRAMATRAAISRQPQAGHPSRLFGASASQQKR